MGEAAAVAALGEEKYGKERGNEDEIRAELRREAKQRAGEDVQPPVAAAPRARERQNRSHENHRARR